MTARDGSLLLFIPEVGIYPYARTLAVLGDAVQRCGGQVFLTHCTGQMIRCPMLSMVQAPVNATQSEKKNVCKQCARYFDTLQKRYAFSAIDLAAFYDASIRHEITTLTDVPAQEWSSLKYKGFAVGEIAQFDFALEKKKLFDPNISMDSHELYVQYIHNTALAAYFFHRILQENTIARVVTFNQYAQCQAVRYVAKENAIEYRGVTYPVHISFDASKFTLFEASYFYEQCQHCQNWHDYKNFPVAQNDALACWDDVLFRNFGQGSHIFSPPAMQDPLQIFSTLHNVADRKILVVYTSSLDERVGVEKALAVWEENPQFRDAFIDQVSWLKYLRDYAIQRNDIQVIVRIHPREGKKRNAALVSQHLKELEAAFTEKRDAFVIIWPDDPVSSYDLMELADVCLVPWGTIGQEAARLGIPVLAMSANMVYPDDDFIQTAATPEEYTRKLTAMLDAVPSWQQLTKAVRFYHWRTFVPSLDLSETVPADFENDAIWPSAPADMVEPINAVLHGTLDPVAYTLEKWQQHLPPDALEQERLANLYGIRKVLDAMFYPPAPRPKPSLLFRLIRRAWRELTGKTLYRAPKPAPAFIDYRLEYEPDVTQLAAWCAATARDPQMRVIVAEGRFAHLVHHGSSLRRMSPMVVRLAKLHAEAAHPIEAV